MIKIKDIEVNIDIPKHLRKIQDDTFWKFSASEWHKLYTPYVPMDTGTLKSQVNIKPKEIEHTAIYAKRNYENNYNFKKDENKSPFASKEWDKAAEPTQKPKLIKTMQNYVDSGRLKLND